ncbi:PH domain-like protein [Xylariaceae sp. FL1651]|nr:PH domain-like protein [Xylariaceae sp. FL1651]
MPLSTPRRNQNQNRHPSIPSSHSSSNNQFQHQHHAHGQTHMRNRSQQLQAEAQQQQLPTTSDYESDTAHYMASHPAMPTATLAARTNTELNLSVLKRYLPSITSILSIAANAVVYTFQPPTEWKRSNTEGTMFVCSQGEHAGEVNENGCLFVLNRKGSQNFILDLNSVSDFELAGDLLIFKLYHETDELHLESGEAVAPRVLGLWTYAEDETDRQTNATLIYEMWSKVRDAREQRAAAGLATSSATAETGPAAEAVGRKVSLTDLFAGRN